MTISWRAALRPLAVCAVIVGLSSCSSGQQSTPAPAPGATASSGQRSTPAPAPGGTASCSTPAGAGAVLSPPTGVVAFSNKVHPLPPAVFTDQAVSGVDPDMGWDLLEPAAGTYDWSALDCVFQQAHAHGKWVGLSLFPGFASPPWVFKLPGVQSQSFQFSYSGAESARPLPLPWNQAYLHSWFDFLAAVASRYASSPEFRLIQVAGPTSVSAEMSLPDRTSGDTALPPDAHGSDVAEWMRLGYTPAKFVDAWREAFDQYHRLFPNQYLGLELYPGLPIGNDGRLDHRQKRGTQESVVAAGMRYKQQFDLQEDGIKGASTQPSDPEYNAVRAHCDDIVTGLRNSVTMSPADQGSMNRALDAVSAAGVDFWEVYTPDVTNPSLHPILATASTKLPANKGCVPR
jgi:Beta-galactosidase